MIAPRGDRVLVQPDKPAESIGMIVLPTESQKKPMRGVVLAVGDGVKGLVAGDVVLYSKFAGADVELDTELGEQRLFRDEDILAIVKEDG